ncbi:MAG: translation initiation factor IF-2 [Magnetococcales bacterium]|nr:translation initiation factor IF-2 [Magnetococcales bacterium]
MVLKKTVEGGSIRQNFSHGRSKSVVVEVRKKRTFVKAGEESVTVAQKGEASPAPTAEQADVRSGGARSAEHKQILAPITSAERALLQQQAQEAQQVQEARRAGQEEEGVREPAVEHPPVERTPLEPVVPSRSASSPLSAAPLTPEALFRSETASKSEATPLELAAALFAPAPAKPAAGERVDAGATTAAGAPERTEPIPAVSSAEQEQESREPQPSLVGTPRPTASARSMASVKSLGFVARGEGKEGAPKGGSGKGFTAAPRREEGADAFRRDGGAAGRRTASPPRREEGASRSGEGGVMRREGAAGSSGEGRTTTAPTSTSFTRPSAPRTPGATRSAPASAPPAGRRPERAPVVEELSGDGLAAAKKLTRAQREDVARKKTDALVTKRLSQLDEMRRQKQEVDEKRKLDSVVPAPARVVFKTGKLKHKGKAIIEEEEKQIPMRRGRGSGKNKFTKREESQTLGPVIREVTVPDLITVGELASRMAVKSSEVIKRLMAQGMMVTINQILDQDTAVLVVEEMGHRAKQVSEAAAIDAELADVASQADALKLRSPVVTVMGHVDHGKTSLLDAIRKSDVASREFGGITQHIGAYQVSMANGASITFLDTPGHAAFTAMRARGAHVTDIVVLVVAADDGVMPQTIEAINHAKDARVPIVVAINKIDKQGINVDRVTQQLADQGLVPEEWGGETIFVKVSAHTGQGIESLEEMILLQSEVLNLQADVNQRARGAIVEAKLDKGRGPVATCLVQNGTLRVGDIFVAGMEWGKIRNLIDDKGRNVTEALPSMPVEIIGFSGIPEAGDELITVPDERRAKEIAAFRMRKSREQGQAKHTPQMDDIFDQIQKADLDEVRVIIKGDVRGSVEAVAESLGKIVHAAVRVNVIHLGVGGINESDVMLASASDAIIVGFNVRADAKSRELAKREKVDMRFYTVIYDLMDEITQALEGKLKPLVEETVVGRAKVRELFRISKIGLVAGCIMMEGIIQRKSKVRLLRGNVTLYTGDIQALKRFKDDAKEVREGMECGICLDKFSDIKPDDIIEAFTLQEVRQTIAR